MRFCPQCQQASDTILCRGCHRFLSQDPAEVDSFLTEPPVPSGPLSCATAWAHWGDTIACMSYAKWIVDQKRQPNCDFLYTGPIKEMREFLACQPWIGTVHMGKVTDQYLHAYAMACNEMTDPSQWLPLVRQTPSQPRTEMVWPTHPSFCQSKLYRTYPLRGIALPTERQLWAAEWWAANIAEGRRVFLLHPESTWSESAKNHWPHWKKAIWWLLEQEKTAVFLLTGLNEGFEVKHPRLINLIRKTPSMMEVFALAGMCDGVISTCNGLSLYTIAADIPGLICGNRVMDNHAYYFRRYVERAPNMWLDVDSPLEEFEEVAASWLKAPRVYTEALRVQDRRRGRVLSEARVHAAKTSPQSLMMTYKVIRGIVSGKHKDFSVGSIVAAEELNGDPDIYVGQGYLQELGPQMVAAG